MNEVWNDEFIDFEMNTHFASAIALESYGKEKALSKADELLSKFNKEEVRLVFSILVTFGLYNTSYGRKPIYFNMLRFLKWLRDEK